MDATLFGINPSGFHATSLAIHGLNVVLLFAWLVRCTGSYYRSLAVAALFGVHPLHVESVAWVAERKDVLSGFWMMVTLLAYERNAAHPSIRWYLVTAISFALGLMSKSMLVTLPILLLLVDFWPLQRWKSMPPSEMTAGRYPLRSTQWLLCEKVPLLALSLLDGVVTIIAQGTISAFTSSARLPFSTRAGNAAQGYAWYISKTVWPTGLCAYYPHPLDGLEWDNVALAVLFLVGCSTYVGVYGLRRPHLLFGWLWFLFSLLPVIGLLQVGSQAYADRYSYLPHVGLIVLTIWECNSCLEMVSQSRFRRSGRSDFAVQTGLAETVDTSIHTSTQISPLHHGMEKSVSGQLERANCIGIAFVVLSVGALGWLTAKQVAVWRTTDTLWAHAIAVDHENWFARLQVGNKLVQDGHTEDETLDHFKVVLRYRPDHAIALNNVGWIHQCREEWAVAEKCYRRALLADIRMPKAMHNLIAVLKKQGRIEDGFDLAKIYSDQIPDDAIIQKELGIIHVSRGQMELAHDRFRQAVKISPNYTSARNNLALVLARLGRNREAQVELETVLSQQPDDANAHVNLGMLLEKEGQLEAARDHFSAALQLNPADQDARDRKTAIDQRLSSP